MPNTSLAACRAVAFTIALSALTVVPTFAQQAEESGEKLDIVLAERAVKPAGRSRVIVEFKGSVDERAITAQRGRTRRRMSRQNAVVVEVDNQNLAGLAADLRVERVSVDRPAFASLTRAGAAIGATVARAQYGLTGAGIGVAVIDSGITSHHDDFYLVDGVSRTRQALAHFKDFTNAASTTPSDEFGHGTHVSGIIAGSGYDSNGARSGVAPGASLVSLKVLDGEGNGYISDVIEALDYAVSIKDTYNVRVINLSVASGVFESYRKDPLARAAKRAVDAGIVVVAAGGNLGTNDAGQVQFGGITSPGNSPSVLTVGAASHQGTARRSDDIIGGFSSRGPTAIDFDAKPDVVAPGVGIEAPIDPNSTLSRLYPQYLVNGSQDVRSAAYLSLSGTSMAAPFVAGTVALMLEANPELTPNEVKAILQYTAQVRDNVSPFAQGAGLVNTVGAIRLARFFGDVETNLGSTFDVIEGERVRWARHIIWGNYRVTGGLPMPGSNAWALNTTWGAMQTKRGAGIVWGARTVDGSVAGAADRDNIVWATSRGQNIVWATGGRDNIVWATNNRENIVWATGVSRNIVWATQGRDNIVWATRGRDNIVWATNNRENIVWATAGRENIVWATRGRDNIVWATAIGENLVWANDCDGDDCQRTIWGSRKNGTVVGTARASDNIVWATRGRDNIVWATADRDNIVWATGGRENIVWATNGANAHNVLWSAAEPEQGIQAAGVR